MKHHLILCIALIISLSSSLDVRAQRATEQFIPLGQSPGISSVIGQIGAVDRSAQTVTVETPAGEQSVRITEQTRIWLDRSSFRQSTLAGGIGDLRAGQQIEVKFLDDLRRDSAEWIKVVPERDS